MCERDGVNRGRVEIHPATVDRFPDVATVLAPKKQDSPACWCLTYRLRNAENSGPRGQDRLTVSRTIPRVDDIDVWSIVCFVVRAPFRRRGLAHDILSGAVAFARRPDRIRLRWRGALARPPRPPVSFRLELRSGQLDPVPPDAPIPGTPVTGRRSRRFGYRRPRDVA
jgi:hypothetical protein